MAPPVKRIKTEYAGLDSTSEEEDEAPLAKTTTSKNDQTNKNDQEDVSPSRDNDNDNDNPSPLRPPVVFEPRSTRKRKNGVTTQTSRHDIKWNEMFNRLDEYKAEHGNCLVPQNYKTDGRLGRWVHYQRVEFWMLKQKKSGKITQSRIDKLDSIGFEWDPQKSKWNRMFRRLVDFKTEHGHCMVPKGYKEDKELANWVRNQRLEYHNLETNKKCRMTTERKDSLNSIGFQWNARS
jgi:hypothetical protein